MSPCGFECLSLMNSDRDGADQICAMWRGNPSSRRQGGHCSASCDLCCCPSMGAIPGVSSSLLLLMTQVSQLKCWERPACPWLRCTRTDPAWWAPELLWDHGLPPPRLCVPLWVAVRPQTPLTSSKDHAVLPWYTGGPRARCPPVPTSFTSDGL